MVIVAPHTTQNTLRHEVLLQRFQDDALHSQTRTREIEALNRQIDRSERRLTGALLGSAVGLSAVLVLLFGSEVLGSVAAAQGVGTALCAFGIMAGLYSWLATARRP